jgi:hypothetical protein
MTTNILLNQQIENIFISQHNFFGWRWLAHGNGQGGQRSGEVESFSNNEASATELPIG